MNKDLRLLKRVLSLLLICSLILPLFAGCKSSVVSNYNPTIDTSAIADSITDALQSDNTTSDDSVKFSVDWFVYEKIYSSYSLVYDTFSAVLHLSDGTEIFGFAYTDYASYYEAEDGSAGFFPAGFVADFGYSIPAEDAENGLIIENLEYTDETYQFVYAYDTSEYAEHCVVNGQYLQYGINISGAIWYTLEPYAKDSCDESLGALYSYDEERYLYDPNVGTYTPVAGVSLSECIDYTALEAELNRVLENQDYNFSEQEIVSAAYIAQESVVNHLLSLQEETFLGCKVSDLIACAETLDPTEYIRLTSDGYVIIDVDAAPGQGADALAKWVVGISCGIVVIGSTAINIFVPAARPLCGAISGAAVDVFMQVVVQNQAVDNIQWSKVAVAAVSGAMMAWLCPLAASSAAGSATTALESELLGKLCGYGVLTLSNSLVSGVTNFAIAKIDGEDGWNAFLAGAAIGAACTVFASALSEILTAVGPKVTSFLARSTPGKWLNKALGEAGAFINKHQVHLKNASLENILNPKSVHEASKQALLELSNQSGAQGGCYTDLIADGQERHEMPAFSANRDATGVDNRNEAKLPAIKMSKQDHRMTASYGSSPQAQQYRQQQAALIAEGNIKAAIQMDIDDLHSKFGTKYNDAIEEMLAYAAKMGWW